MSRFDIGLRTTLRGLADELIPGGDDLPGAVAADVHDTVLDRVLAARPDLAAPLQDVLERALALEPAEAIRRLRGEHPRAFEVLSLVVAGGYLMSPQVAAALRYPFQEAKVVDPNDVVSVITDGLLDAVIERGPIYRTPSDAPEHPDTGRNP